jgi:hypothetical protein
LLIVGINQQSKLHAARLASCRFTVGAVEFSVSSREPVVDTYAGERPSQFSPPFSPFELVHCCIERYLCVAQVHSPSQEGGSRAETRTPIYYVVSCCIWLARLVVACVLRCALLRQGSGQRLVRLTRLSGSPLGTWMGPWLLPGCMSAVGMYAHTPSFQCNNVFVPCVF